MAAISRVSYRVKGNTGRRFKVGGESTVSAADALAYAQAKLKAVSGQSTLYGSQSTGLDLTDTANQPGHTDAADGLNIEMQDADGVTRNIHVPQVSKSYAGTAPGTAVITGDILAIVTAYNTANGTAFTIVSAHYTAEG